MDADKGMPDSSSPTEGKISSLATMCSSFQVSWLFTLCCSSCGMISTDSDDMLVLDVASCVAEYMRMHDSYSSHALILHETPVGTPSYVRTVEVPLQMTIPYHI